MSAYPFRLGPLVAVGLIAGLAHVVVGVALYLAGVYFEPFSLRVMIGLLAACIAVGTWWYGKYVLGGRITYWKALLVGVVISVCSALVYVTYNIISVSFVYAHFLEDMVQAQFARASAGIDPARAAELLDSLRAQLTLRTLVVGNLTAVCRLGTMFSVVISLGFMRRWRRARRVAAEPV